MPNKSRLEFKPFYQRNLPHYQPPGAKLFVTFRLADSLPKEAVQQLLEESERIENILTQISNIQERKKRAYHEQKRLFGKWDAVLDTNQNGPFWLWNSNVAALVAESIHYRDGKFYDLDAFCIMPNHVHIVFKPLRKNKNTYYALPAILHSLKLYTARRANIILQRTGTFWQHENYDHVIRDESEKQD